MSKRPVNRLQGQHVSLQPIARHGSIVRANGADPNQPATNLCWADPINLSDTNQAAESSFTIVDGLNKAPNSYSFLQQRKGVDYHLKFVGSANTDGDGTLHLGNAVGNEDLASFFILFDTMTTGYEPRLAAIQSAHPNWPTEFLFVRAPSKGNRIARHARANPPRLASSFVLLPAMNGWPPL